MPKRSIRSVTAVVGHQLRRPPWLKALAACALTGCMMETERPPYGANRDEGLDIEVDASSQHGTHAPANTLDGDLTTRWSAKGDGQWIRYDLGDGAAATRVDIAWFKGDQRTASFTIEVADDAGGPWTSVLTGAQSSGAALDAQSFELGDATGRYLRVVGHGNSSNAWNSITEVTVFGFGGNGGVGEPPAPPLPPAGSGPVDHAFFATLEFGPTNEPCHTNGTRVGPGDDWESAVQNASSGDVILFEHGTYEDDEALRVPNGVTLYAYDCQDASIVIERSNSNAGRGDVLDLGDDVVIAGLSFEGPNTEAIVRFGSDQDRIVLRNNALLGGRNDAIVFRDDSSSEILFEGNFINSGPAQPGGITGSSGGHIIYFAGNSQPTDVVFRRNKIQGNYFGDARAGDDSVAIQGGRFLVFEENWFDEQYNIENFWDIKTATTADDHGAVVARRNLFTNGCLGTKGGQDGNSGGSGSALTFGDFITNPDDMPIHLFENNRLEIGTGRCSKYFTIGQNRDTKLMMVGNVFVSDNDDAPDGGQLRNVHDVTIAHNTFYRGAIAKIADNSGQLVNDGKGLTIENNLFYRGNLNDRSDNDGSNEHVVRYNLMYDMESELEGGNLSNNIEGQDPKLEDSMLPSLDLRLRSDSPAKGAASDGTNIGAY